MCFIRIAGDGDQHRIFQETLPAQLLGENESIDPGHCDIQQQHIGLKCGGQFERGCTIVGHPRLVFPHVYQHGQAVGCVLAIIGNQHA